MKRKIISMIVVTVMLMVMFPLTAFAGGESNWKDQNNIEKGSLIIYGNKFPVIENYMDKSLSVVFEVYGKDGFLRDSETIQIAEQSAMKDTTKVKEFFSKGVYILDEIVDETGAAADNPQITYKLHENWIDSGKLSKGTIIIYGSNFPNIVNLMDKNLSVVFEVYDKNSGILKDAETIQIEKNGYMDDTAKVEEFFSQGVYILDEIVDETETIAENPKLTYRFHETRSDMTEAQKSELESIESEMKGKLSGCEGAEHNVKVANLSSVGINEWTDEEAVANVLGSDALAEAMDVDRAIFIKNGKCSYFLEVQYYLDQELKNPVEDGVLKADTEYYAVFKYQGFYEFDDGLIVASEVSIDKPAKVSASLVDVPAGTAEIEKIKENLKTVDPFKISYEDLAWINVLAYMGYNPKLPSMKNANSIIQTLEPDTYKQLVGDTDLNLRLSFGGAGDASAFSSDTSGIVYYYVDDVFYASGTSCNIIMTDVIYVPDGSNDRAAAAEARIKEYMGDEKYDVEVAELSPQELLALAKDEFSYEDWSAYEDAEAAYLTKNGIAIYKDEKSTTQDDFIDILSYIPNDVFDEGTLEKNVELEYVITGDFGNEVVPIQSYKPYKITLNGKDYIFVIGTKPESELTEPFANWKDEATGIVTEGQNGQVIADAYTKITVVSDEQELKEIEAEIGENNTIKAFNIDAFTNFEDGKITDLGGGKMKVSIPLGDMSEEGLAAYYYDENGNVECLDYVVEEIDGVKCVSLITNHFSVYGIASGVKGQNGNADNNVNGGNGTNDGSVKGQNADSNTSTGDDFNVLAVGLIALVALLLGTIVFAGARKRKNI